jgi:hypothetical protein
LVTNGSYGSQALKLEKRMDSAQKFNLGNEIVVKTKDGKSFNGIFVNVSDGYLSAVLNLGIILTIPLVSVINVVKV